MQQVNNVNTRNGFVVDTHTGTVVGVGRLRYISEFSPAYARIQDALDAGSEADVKRYADQYGLALYVVAHDPLQGVCPCSGCARGEKKH